MPTRPTGNVSQDSPSSIYITPHSPLISLYDLKKSVSLYSHSPPLTPHSPLVSLHDLKKSVSLFSILHHLPSTSRPTRPTGNVSQDREPVVLHKSRPKSKDLRDPKAVNQALQSGSQVQTVKKFNGGSNRKAPATAVCARKLDEAAEPAAIDRVPAEVRMLIQKARLEKKMSQVDLGKMINERPQVVQEYENGKAVPNQAVLAKMERVLGVKLRGKINHK